MANDASSAFKSALDTKRYHLYEILIQKLNGEFYAYAGETSNAIPVKRPRQICKGSPNAKKRKDAISYDFEKCGDKARVEANGWDAMERTRIHVIPIEYPNVLISSIAELALMKKLRDRGFFLYNRSLSGGHEHLNRIEYYRDGFDAIVRFMSKSHIDYPDEEQIEAMHAILPEIEYYAKHAATNDPLNAQFFGFLQSTIIEGLRRLRDIEKNQLHNINALNLKPTVIEIAHSANDTIPYDNSSIVSL